MEELCRGCELTPWLVVAKFHGEVEGNSAGAVRFLRGHGVLPNEVLCPFCHIPCSLREEEPLWYCTNYTDNHETKRRKPCNYSVSDYKGTIFEKINLEPWKLVLFVNQWLQKHWDHDEVIENLHFSTEACVNWRSDCFEVTESWLWQQEPIGGEGVVVEIDKSLFWHTKKEEREPLSDEVWVFGGIERETKKLFAIPLAEENKDTLIPVIKKFICPGSVIVSDDWRACRGVKDHGYTHFVNYTENLRCPGDSEIHTQNIKQFWLDLKERVKKCEKQPEYYFRHYLSRYLFIHHYKNQLLHCFFVEAGRQYPFSGGYYHPGSKQL